MTQLGTLTQNARFITASGHYGKRLANRGIRGVRVELEIEGAPVVRFLHGSMLVHLLPSLTSSCGLLTSRPRRYLPGEAEQTHKLHARIA